MSTGDKRVSFFVDRLLSRNDFEANFMNYLDQQTRDSFAALLQSRSGTLDADKITLAADGNDQFQLDVSLADEVVVDTGEILTILAAVVGESRNIFFQNTVAITYYVALRYGQISADVDVNPRKANPEYKTLQDVVGEVGIPDSFVDNPGVNLKVIIDTVTEATVSNAGRKARIYLATPVSSDPAVAFFDTTTLWDGTNNYIDLPYSGANGPLGQDTSSDPPSTTAIDYTVWIKGPTVSRLTDLSLNSTYAFVGTIIGVGLGSPPAVFDETAQVAVFLFSLDAAYQGAGSGSGNIINVGTINRPINVKGFAGITAIRPDQHQVMQYDDFDGKVSRRMMSFGRLEEIPRIKDGFNYNSTKWTNSATAPYDYNILVGGGATLARAKPASGAPDLGTESSGVAEFRCDGAIAAFLTVEWQMLRVENRLPALFLRMAPDQLLDQDMYIGLKRHGVLFPGFGFYIDNALLKGYSETAAPVITATATLHTFVGDDLVNCYAVTFADAGSATNFSIAFWVTGMTVPTIVDAPVDFAVMAGASYDWQLNCAITPKVGGIVALQTLWLDHWEAWSRHKVIGA